MNIAVIGAGTIGNLCTQLLALKGHRPTAFDKNENKLNLLKNKIIETRSQISGLEHFKYIVEATGKVEALKQAILNSMTGAKILILGLPYEKMNFNFEKLVAFDKSVIGSVGSSSEDFRDAIKILNRLNLQEFTNHIFTLDEYTKAWEKRREGQILKAIIKLH